MSTNQVASAPLLKEEILQRLREHKLNWFDLAVEVANALGSKTWKLLIEIEDFIGDFPEMGSTHPAAFYGWVVRRNPEQSAVPSTALSTALIDSSWIGPMDHPTLSRKIAAGEISYSDVLWRPGMRCWERIGANADFSNTGAAMPLSSSEEYSINNKYSLEAAAPLAVAQVEKKTLIQEPPAEAFGIDLVGELPWMRTLMLALAICGLNFAGLRSQAATVRTLQIVAIRLNTDKPSFVLQTDAPSGEAIDVAFYGQSGEILDHLSWQKRFHLVRKQGEIPTIEFGAGEIPRGTVTVEAESGGTKTVQKVFIGRDDREFRSELKSYVKSTAAERQNEKMALFHEAQNLKGLTRKLAKRLKKASGEVPDQSQWQTFYAGWTAQLDKSEKALQSIMPDERGELAYPEQIADCLRRSGQLKVTALQVKDSFVGNQQFAGQAEPARDLASESVRATMRGALLSIELEFQRLQSKASRL